MRKLIASALIAGSALFGCGRDVPKESAIPSQLEAGIERELRKADFWVDGLVEQDYTGSAKSAAVSIKTITKDKTESAEKFGIAGANGYFDADRKEMKFPEQVCINDVLESVNHELSHAAYSAIVESAEYSGPSKKEIADYCAKKVSCSEFDRVRSTIRLRELLHETLVNTERMNRFYQKGGIKDQKIRKISSRINSADFEYLTGDEEKEFGENLKSCTARMSDAIKAYKEAQNRYNAAVAPVAGVEQMSNEDIVKSYENAKIAAEQITRQHQDTVQTMNHFCDIMNKTLDTAENRKHELRIAELKSLLDKAKTDDTRNVLKSAISDAQETARAIKEARQLEYLSFDRLTDLESDLTGVINQSNKERLSNMLEKPDEVLARMVNSMYSVYFGSVKSNKFPLSDDDLKFLEKFTYKGRQMFEKGISKYRLGMQMVKDGIAPDSVKKQLEYAVNFEYKGQKYTWPETNFRIRGNIPCEK